MKIYTRVDGKLAVWGTDSDDLLGIVAAVRLELGPNHTVPILVLIPGGKT